MAATARRSLLARLAAVTIVALAFLGGGTETAAAASPVILVSTDGVTFTPSLRAGMFDGAGLLIPGGSETSRLWIKNPTSTAASVRVTIGQLVTPSVDFAQNVTMDTWDSVSNSTTSRQWSDLAQCGVLMTPHTLAGGRVLEVTLTLTMRDATGMAAQHQNGSLNVVVGMRDNAAGRFPTSGCGINGAVSPSSFHGSIAFTGTEFPSQLLIAGAVLLGVGWFFVLVRRRRRRRES
jgi:LPXTG-motif cell wall-anchored protein